MPMRDVKLSPMMIEAIKFARSHGGKIERYPGGFWGGQDAQPFGTPTVEALVKREQGTYTAWKDGRSGRFPVEFTLKVI